MKRLKRPVVINKFIMAIISFSCTLTIGLFSCTHTSQDNHSSSKNLSSSENEDSINAVFIFGDDYIVIKEKVIELKKKDIRTTSEELELSHSNGKIKDLEQMAKAHIQKAQNMSEQERANLSHLTKEYSKLLDQLYSLGYETYEIVKEESQRENALGTQYGWDSQEYKDGVRLLKQEMRPKKDSLDQREKSIRERIKESSDKIEEALNK